MKSVLAMVLAAGVSTAAISLPSAPPVTAIATAIDGAAVPGVERAASFDRHMISADFTNLLGVFIGTGATDAIAGAVRSCLSTVLQAPAEGGSLGPQA